LVVGENLYDDGGPDEIRSLVRVAQRELEAGRKRVTFGAEYRGSLLWHRVGCFASILAEHEKILLTTKDPHGVPVGNDVSNAWNYVAFCEHVKCSPARDSQNPYKDRCNATNEMWQRCGGHVLREEIQILKPNYLLVLGIGHNGAAIRRNVVEGITGEKRVGQIICAVGRVCEQRITVIIVPHPSLGRGAAVSRLTELRTVLLSKEVARINVPIGERHARE
jgi:hypothetical protein